MSSFINALKLYYHKYVKLSKSDNLISSNNYYQKYIRYSFDELNCCSTEKQFEGNITRLYHIIEKGLAYLDYRPGFGKENVLRLITILEAYSKKYDTSKFFYRTALCVLKQYIDKNQVNGFVDDEVNTKINSLPGTENNAGGIIQFQAPTKEFLSKANYQELISNRHSIRHFSLEPVDIKIISEAIVLAQYTPSACNRQGWKSRIVSDKNKIKVILDNQNGNRGFGQEIDKLVIVTGDISYFSSNHELHQVFIDGGMYAMRVLDSLYYKGIASIPLSASLTSEQEKNIRPVINMKDEEVFILIIGIGNYPSVCQTTRSERKPTNIEIF